MKPIQHTIERLVIWRQCRAAEPMTGNRREWKFETGKAEITSAGLVKIIGHRETFYVNPMTEEMFKDKIELPPLPTANIVAPKRVSDDDKMVERVAKVIYKHDEEFLDGCVADFENENPHVRQSYLDVARKVITCINEETP